MVQSHFVGILNHLDTDLARYDVALQMDYLDLYLSHDE